MSVILSSKMKTPDGTIKQCIEQHIMNGFDEAFEFNKEDIE